MKNWMILGASVGVMLAAGVAFLMDTGRQAADTSARPAVMRTIQTAPEPSAALEAITARNGAQAVEQAQFQTVDGRAFRLTRVNGGALIVFDDTGEILELTEGYGRGGDVILRNDAGRVVLRLTSRGNAILYSTDRSLGEPVSMVQIEDAGEAPTLKPATAG